MIRRFFSFRFSLLGIVSVGVLFIAVSSGRAQQAGDKDDSGKMMDSWSQCMKPGTEVEGFRKLVGRWNCTMRVYVKGPGQPPVEGTGTSVLSLALADRYLLQQFQGQMMGATYTGQGLMGFDPLRKQFVSTWADSLSGTISYMTGGRSPDAKTYTSFGTVDEPWSGEIGKTVKYVLTIVDDDTLRFTAWQVTHAEDARSFEIEYRRAK